MSDKPNKVYVYFPISAEEKNQLCQLALNGDLPAVESMAKSLIEHYTNPVSMPDYDIDNVQRGRKINDDGSLAASMLDKEY